jgi:hypothetical protein
MRIAFKALIVLGLLVASGSYARADDIVWTFNDVTFTNGNTLTGSFTTNSAVTQVLSVSAVISGPDSADAFTAALVDSAYLPTEIGLATSSWSEYADLYPASDLTSAGGVIDLTGGYDCPGCGVLVINADNTPTIDGVDPSVPEPSSAALLGIGLGFLGLGLRRKKSAPAAK